MTQSFVVTANCGLKWFWACKLRMTSCEWNCEATTQNHFNFNWNQRCNRQTTKDFLMAVSIVLRDKRTRKHCSVRCTRCNFTYAHATPRQMKIESELLLLLCWFLANENLATAAKIFEENSTRNSDIKVAKLQVNTRVWFIRKFYFCFAHF